MADQYARTQFWVHPDTRIGVHVQQASGPSGGIPSLRLGGTGYVPVIDIVTYGYDRAETAAGLRRLAAAIDLLVGMIETQTDGEQEIDELPERWPAFPPAEREAVA